MRACIESVLKDSGLLGKNVLDSVDLCIVLATYLPTYRGLGKKQNTIVELISKEFTPWMSPLWLFSDIRYILISIYL